MAMQQQMSKVVRSACDAGERDGDRGRRVVIDANEHHSAGAHPGDLVLQSLPFAKVLQPELWSSHCHHCFTTESAKLSRCGRCRTAYYCSRDCQQKDWKPDHQVECRQLEQLVPLRLRGPQIADLLLLGRVMRRLQVGGSSGNTTGNQEVSPTELVWYEADLSQESMLLATLAQKLKLVDESTSTRELQKMLSRFENNNFSICDDLLLEIGAGCFPLGAMVNHSCDPNCAVTFTAKTQLLEFRAMRAIAFDEEITQSYVDIALPRRERQRRLEHKYHFQCNCARCATPLSDPQSLDAHLDADIDGIPESQWSDERVKEFERAKALLMRPDGSEDPIKTLQMALQAMQSALHEENISMLQAHSALFSAEMERGSIDEAIPSGEKMIEFYRRVYPANHPLVGLHLFTLGDLHLQTPDTQGSSSSSKAQAKRYLTEAKQILQITHGKSHHFVELLSQRIQNC